VRYSEVYKRVSVSHISDERRLYITPRMCEARRVVKIKLRRNVDKHCKDG
jgi:hypothetical protein